MTEESLRQQITVNKGLKKILADKIKVSEEEEEIDAYIKSLKTVSPIGTSMEDFRKQINDQLAEQKFRQIAPKWVNDLITNAKIKYYVNY